MKRIQPLALLVVLAALVAGCNGGDTIDTTPTPDARHLLLLQPQAPSQANAWLSTGTSDLLASSLVQEPLAEYDPDGAIVPALAAEIPTEDNGGISADKTQITWKLQEGLLWSDGSSVTADDVVFTWEYCDDDLTGCTSSAFGSVSSVEAVDELSVTITFDGPQTYPFVPFVGYANPILQRTQMADCIGEAAKSCTDQNSHPIGTGPYVVTELHPDETASYSKNPNYRKLDEDKPYFNTVEIRGGMEAEDAARSVLETGEADYAWNLQLPPEILRPIEAAGIGRVELALASNVEHINLNQTNPDTDPPSDFAGGANPNPYFFEAPDLARALSMAIDREEIIAVGYGAAGVPTCNWWPVGDQNSTNNDWCLAQDIEGANTLLDEAGYLDQDLDGIRETPDGLPLSWDFVTTTNAVRQSVQDLIAVYWEQIGVDTTMRNEDASLFFDGTNASDSSIWKFFTDIQMFTSMPTSSPATPDALSNLERFKIGEIPESANGYEGNNIPRYASREYDALWDTLAATSLDDPDRADHVARLNDMVVEYAIIPLVNRGTVSAFRGDISGVGKVNGWDSEYWNIEHWVRD